MNRQSWSEWFPETDAEHQERFSRAMTMTPEQQLGEGFRLCEKETEMGRECLRREHPNMTVAEIDQTIAAQNEEWRKRDGKDYGTKILGLIP